MSYGFCGNVLHFEFSWVFHSWRNSLKKLLDHRRHLDISLSFGFVGMAIKSLCLKINKRRHLHRTDCNMDNTNILLIFLENKIKVWNLRRLEIFKDGYILRKVLLVNNFLLYDSFYSKSSDFRTLSAILLDIIRTRIRDKN